MKKQKYLTECYMLMDNVAILPYTAAHTPEQCFELLKESKKALKAVKVQIYEKPE